ncbi:MAG: LPS export ABC transporter periplasmic protein LptC [Magnetococcales bacterium]|nr:LPS export ABC transporter periplasmic protein LptC [Magnetococcales bacterium]
MSYTVKQRMAHSMGWSQLRRSELVKRSSLSAWITSLKFFFLAIAAIMVAVIIWYLRIPVGLGVDPETSTAQQSDSAPVNLATKIHLEQFDGYRTQWTLDGVSARWETERVVIVETPSLVVFRESGEKIKITAKRGTVDKNSRTMNFHGVVRAQGDGQFGLLTTEWLQFNPNKGILFTDQRFYLENKTAQLKGVGLTLFQKIGKFHVHKNVEMKFLSGVPTLPAKWGS